MIRRPPTCPQFPYPPLFRSPVTGSVLAPPRLQLLALKLPPPGGTLLALQLTVPLGALAEVGVLSVTVAVQLVGLPTGTVSGAQLPTRLVAGFFPVPTKLPALLRCVGPPLELPLMVGPPPTAGV